MYIKISSILWVLILTLNSFAQSPEKISYQTVIRNSAGDLVINHEVGMRISILKGSEAGAAVFTQTLTTTTNANGLAGFEIGGGSFSSINWDEDTYYIKTECDPAGGTNYTITGTSQILSVPYALHAKTAEGFAGNEIFFKDNGQIASFDDKHRILFRRDENILELREFGKIVFSPGSTDGNTTGQMKLMEDGNIELNNKNIRNLADPLNAQDAATKAYVDANDGFSGDYNDLTNKPGNATSTSDGFMSSSDKVKLNGIATGAEVNVNANWNAASGDALIMNKPDLSVYATKNMGNQRITNLANPVNAKDAATKAYVDGITGNDLYVGKFYGGGIIFYIDPIRKTALIAALYDISIGTHWSNIYSESAGVSARSHWDGLSNSNAIVAQAGHATSAAKLCLDFENEGKTDWYLPSVREFQLLFYASYIVDKVLTEDNNPDTYGLRFYSNANYWTSTECFSESAKQAFFFHYMNGAGSMSKGVWAKVRPIRRFSY